MFNRVKRIATCLTIALLLALFTLPSRYLTRFAGDMEVAFAAAERAAADGDAAQLDRQTAFLHERAQRAARVLRLFISHDVVDEMALAVLLIDPAGQTEDLRAAITSARAAVEHLCAIELFAWETLL